MGWRERDFYCFMGGIFLLLYEQNVITKWEFKHHFHVLNMVKCHRMLDMQSSSILQRYVEKSNHFSYKITKYVNCTYTVLYLRRNWIS